MTSELVALINCPQRATELSSRQWDQVMSEATVNVMLARLCVVLDRADQLGSVPPTLRWQLQGALTVARAHARDIRMEVNHICTALRVANLSPVFLKGTAYLLAEDDACEGRLFSDVDIFIPAADLDAAERVLQWRGWKSGKLNAYDQQYYRQWMHELPPMVHQGRGMTLDVHHSLLPLTARFAFDPNSLEIEQKNTVQVLSPVDRLLHCIVHLMMETAFEKGLRDMADIDAMCRQFALQSPTFWTDFLQRVATTGLGRLIYYGLDQAGQLYATPIPPDVMEQLTRDYAPNRLLRAVMKRVWRRALTRPLSLYQGLADQGAHFALFLRGHWLKMPVTTLCYHGVRKTWLNLTVKE
ncbi:nucleotidyltransferase family protein [Aestuariibacter halophilus]|uniref:Nucleotidyltransferase family protein n=1 Tax=Fluctibacter halophilus TaxID=226011 RepID=A0ABS8G2U6_9ALTE|nr:nucleotidyltransferase family protein [Aestuariibacter halophilus]MCC2614909.1 nucleotidyltransferase family protein [Aestuariibacter halophilus]